MDFLTSFRLMSITSRIFLKMFVLRAILQGGPIRGFRDTGYSWKKLPGYGIFEEKVIGIQAGY